MQPYNEHRPASNPTLLRDLIPRAVRLRKHLDANVTGALSQMKVWVWPIGRRLARTWNTWRGGEPGAHAKERGRREAQLAGNLALLRERKWYGALTVCGGREQASARAVLVQLHRLLDDVEWWRSRVYVVKETGELKTTLYLPEDTWAAAHLVDWCVSFLERLARAVRGMTERMTPRYKPKETVNPSGRRKEASRDEDEAPWLRCAAKWGEGGQPELPATG